MDSTQSVEPEVTISTDEVRVDYVQSGDGRKPSWVYERRRARFNAWLERIEKDAYDRGVMSGRVELADLREHADDLLAQRNEYIGFERKASEERDAAYAVIDALKAIRDGSDTGIQGTKFDKEADDRRGSFVEDAAVTERIDTLLDSLTR